MTNLPPTRDAYIRTGMKNGAVAGGAVGTAAGLYALVYSSLPLFGNLLVGISLLEVGAVAVLGAAMLGLTGGALNAMRYRGKFGASAKVLEEEALLQERVNFGEARTVTPPEPASTRSFSERFSSHDSYRDSVEAQRALELELFRG